MSPSSACQVKPSMHHRPVNPLPGGVCQQGEQHCGEQEVPQVVGRQLQLKAVLRPQLWAGHDTCIVPLRTGSHLQHQHRLHSLCCQVDSLTSPALLMSTSKGLPASSALPAKLLMLSRSVKSTCTASTLAPGWLALHME